MHSALSKETIYYIQRGALAYAYRGISTLNVKLARLVWRAVGR